uniref:Polyprotein n=1 Tax=Soybean thrips jiivi-like virus 1 TaxID=2806027 RepID=A0A7T8JI84_9VIRU|nr:polyprotein [Soybean thrips jiivi-like virus 1]
MTSVEVNETVISLLEAKGFHPSVGRAFCIGLEKSGKFKEIREIVCSVYKKRVFAPRTQADLDNPSRLYATRRRVITREGKAKFYPPYKMSRHEILLFMARYPEVEVIHKSAKHDNPHAFHANSRHVSTEILLGYVREHADIHELDPTSVVDVGGNESYHASRERNIHCDTPVMSARDKARYLLREVYNGSSASSRCSETFLNCRHSTDFAIAVHSTYDMPTKDIALGMYRRGIKAFYGVIVIPSNLHHLMDGDHSCDGTNISIAGDKAKFTFPYDSSVAYTHNIPDLKTYLRTRDTLHLSNGATYAYRIISIRGDTIFFSVVPMASFERTIGPPTSVVPPMGKYYITIPGITKQPLEVDSQPFDRMVFHAAAARNFESYDIVSLFQFAKSLRASLTINSIILSHGYGSNPSDVVTMVIAAYCVAASFKIESAKFFERVTTQVDNTRRKGFITSVLRVAPKAMAACFAPLFVATGLTALYGMTSAALDSLVSSMAHVEVRVSPSRTTEIPVIDSAPPPIRTVEASGINVSVVQQPSVPAVTPRRGQYVMSEHIKFITLPIVDHDDRILVSVGCYDDAKYDSHSAIPPTPLTGFAKSTRFESVVPFHAFSGSLDAYMTLCNEATHLKLRELLKPGMIIQPVVTTKYGDSVFSIANTRRSFIVRGYGTCLTVVSLPSAYKGRGNVTMCFRYDYDITLPLLAVVNDEPTYEYGTEEVRLAKHLAGGGRVVSDDAVSESEGLSSTLVPSTNNAGPGSGPKSRPSARSSSRPSLHHRAVSNASRASSLAEWAVDSGDVSGDELDLVRSSSSEDQYPFSSLVPKPGSESHPSTDSMLGEVEIQPLDMLPGEASVAELEFFNATFRRAVIATCTSFLDLADATENDQNARAVWEAVSKATPSEPVVLHNEDGQLYDRMHREKANYGGVIWRGEMMPARQFLQNSSEGDKCVSCDDLKVYVVDGIDACVKKYKAVSYNCDVVLKDAPAANGKTYAITHEATTADYCVCETSAALKELKGNLIKRDPAFADRCFTVDSVLVNDRVVVPVDKLFIDEALRLHAGKIYLLMRMLKPSRVICYGDSKQIPAISFQEGYDYMYHKFPFTSIDIDSTSRTMLPCFAMALSTDKYYGRPILTHSKVDALPKASILDHGDLKMKASVSGTMVIVYTQSAKRDFISAGLSNVITIGECQGQRYDHVILVREAPIQKVLYFDLEQTLVALTRCRYSFEYLTVKAMDDSAAAVVLQHIASHHALIQDHVIS